MESALPLQATTSVVGGSPIQGSISPNQTASPKNVAFELLFDSPQHRARLPMRVGIYPHDDTDSIVTTVKNFYGLYSGPTGSMGVSFEDENHNTLIARYENFKSGMTVYVRVHEESPDASAPSNAPLGSAFQVTEPALDKLEGLTAHISDRRGQDVPHLSSMTSRKRSPSVGADSNRTTTSKKIRARSSKSRTNGDADAYSDSFNGYSSGDNAPSSASGRNKDQLGNTDISVENIVEGGRRKRAKFESSELPLFAPPQMPAATSNPSVSPARRVEYHRPLLPIGQQSANPFTGARPIQSPRGFGTMPAGVFSTPLPNERRIKGKNIGVSHTANADGVLPTPDPTVASCMSEEDKDVAIQLMRLGDMSNISHGRTSASTLDDTFSGKADAASSTGATSEGASDSEDEQPAATRQKLNSGVAKPVNGTTGAHFALANPVTKLGGEEIDYNDVEAKSMIKDKMHKASSIKSNGSKVKGPRPVNKAKKMLPPAIHGPMSPASTPSRKPSIFSNGTATGAFDEDQPDLSSKPRCQRCRKSKKGCDRQRPCGRCRDAGLSADQCVSEDEGNGRKGRYGRHMGVPIRKEDIPTPSQPVLLPAAPIATSMTALVDKSKKRKR